MNMKKINNEKGFTLIEMMIVMLVISVLLIITIPMSPIKIVLHR